METSMSDDKKHLPPAYSARLKNEGSDSWETIGNAWNTSRDNVLSVKLDKPVDSFILVPNNPKPPATKATGKKAATNTPK
jgi:hypothetical protein